MMALNFGSDLFRGREGLYNYDWQDVLSGNGYITFYAGILLGKGTTYESYLTGDDADSVPTDTTWIAQTFTIGTTGTNEDFYVTRIRIKVDPAGTDNMNVSIQKVDGAGKPNGERILTISQQIEKQGSTAEGWMDCYLENQLLNTGEKLEAGTQYALVIYKDNGSTSDQVRYDTSSSSYSGGVYWRSTDSGGSWTEQTGDDILFEIIGDTINSGVLATNTFTSDPITTSRAIRDAVEDYTKLGDYVFEGTFQKSSIISGNALLNFTATGSGGTGLDYYFDTELYHVREKTETLIGSGTTIGASSTRALGTQIVLTETGVIKGDKIKLKLVCYQSNTSSTRVTVLLNINPNGTSTTLHLPFKVESIEI